MTGSSKKKMAVIVFCKCFAFPCIFAVLTVVPSKFSLALRPPSWLCTHFSCVWDSRSINKGAWSQASLLGANTQVSMVYGSSRAVPGRKHFPDIILTLHQQHESLVRWTEQKQLRVQILCLLISWVMWASYLNSLNFCVFLSLKWPSTQMATGQLNETQYISR